MYKKVSEIVQYLVTVHSDNFEDKYIIMNLKQIERIQIDVHGEWIKEFSIDTFHGQVWNKNKRQNILIYVGDNVSGTYLLHKIKYNRKTTLYEITSDIKDEPFLDGYDYYVCFVIEVKKKVIENMYSKIKNFIEVIAPNKYPSIKFLFAGTEDFRTKYDKIDKYTDEIINSVYEILKYGASLQFRYSVYESLSISEKQNISNIMRNKMNDILLKSE